MTSIDAMQAGAELDDLVAINVMGWRRGKVATGLWYMGAPGEYAGHRAVIDWKPSLMIEDAWQVVERMGAMRWELTLIHDSTSTRAGFSRDGVPVWATAAPTAPLAICIAACRAEVNIVQAHQRKDDQ